MQFQADLLQCPLYVSPLADMTAFGAAGIAGITHGAWSMDDYSQCKPKSTLYTPQQKQEKNYKHWQHAVTCTRLWPKHND